MSIVDKLVGGLRAAERDDTYHLDRADVTTVAEAQTWLLDYYNPEGGSVWRLGDTGDQQRRHVAEQWLWLRHCHRREIAERGGR